MTNCSQEKPKLSHMEKNHHTKYAKMKRKQEQKNLLKDSLYVNLVLKILNCNHNQNSNRPLQGGSKQNKKQQQKMKCLSQ